MRRRILAPLLALMMLPGGIAHEELVLGAYGCKIVQTLFEAADENPGFAFWVEEEQ